MNKAKLLRAININEHKKIVRAKYYVEQKLEEEFSLVYRLKLKFNSSHIMLAHKKVVYAVIKGSKLILNKDVFNKEEVIELSDIKTTRLRYCRRCFRWFESKNSQCICGRYLIDRTRFYINEPIIEHSIEPPVYKRSFSKRAMHKIIGLCYICLHNGKLSYMITADDDSNVCPNCGFNGYTSSRKYCYR